MARKRQPTSLNRSSLVSVVEFFARKLIIFVLLQLVLSPFILITADTLNGSLNNNGTFAPDLKRQFGCIANTSANPTANVVLGKCTGDGVLVGEPPLNETQQKNANGNSISTQSEVVANGTRSNDGLLPWIKGNATIHNQSRETITGIEFDQFQHQDDNFNMNGERVLSRKRRYLIFPPGSSLQIVYDTYHPIVDATNYLILGITAAMAWELPSKPVNFYEDLHYSNEMEDLKRKDKNILKAQYAHPYNTPNAIDSNGYYTNIPKQKFIDKKSKYQSPYKSYYQSNYKPTSFGPSKSYPPATNKLQNYVSYADSLMKQFKQLTDQIPKNRPLNTNDFQEFANILTKNVKTQRKSDPKYKYKPNYSNHIVHPVFKKRSVDQLTPLEKFDLKLHRNSRHTLYKQINTFLKTQGSDGQECVLKMLCETGQRRHDKQPGSLVIELLRAVFTLPEPLEQAEKIEHRMYDEAHASTDDCQQLFPNCIESVWNSKYM